MVDVVCICVSLSTVAPTSPVFYIKKDLGVYLKLFLIFTCGFPSIQSSEVRV